jgi:iron only hydrogenase large subunit-like protein
MMAAVTKEVWAAKTGFKPEDVISVSIMPCTAKKGEAKRPEMKTKSGVRHTDYVLTTRELGRLFR